MAFSLPPEERGNTRKKDHVFLALLQNETKDLKHPRHHLKMQAHHAISQKAIFDAALEDRLEDFGYEIDVKENLVFIPWTLQGACLLNVQPHRGDHTAGIIKGMEDEHDDDHPLPYHKMVAVRLKAVMPALEEECGDHGKTIKTVTQATLNRISATIIGMIQNDPASARLTALYPYFVPGHERGCGGVDSIRKTGGDKCPVGRNHTGNQQGPLQNEESITYVPNGPYKLEPGK